MNKNKMTEQEKNELIYGSKLKVTLTQKEWRAVLSAVFNASVQMRGYGKIYDKIAKQTNEQVEKILQKTNREHIGGRIDDMIDDIEDAQTADVAPVVHAHWLFINGHLAPMFKCSNCRNIAFNSLYCPYCGAKMDAEGEPRK